MAEKNSLWKNIRNKAKQNRESGATPKKPTTEMLRQERKIKAKYPGGGEMPLGLPLREQNPFLVPEYNQPMANGYILLDPNRPRVLPDVNASEYKSTQGTDTGDVQIPTIVGGQYIGNNGAWERYKNTGEEFKPMADPSSYSKFYDIIEPLGLMKDNRTYAEGGYMYPDGGVTIPKKGEIYQVPTAQDNLIRVTNRWKKSQQQKIPAEVLKKLGDSYKSKLPATGKLDIDPGAELLPLAAFEFAKIPGLVKNYRYNTNLYNNAPNINGVNMAHPRNLQRAKSALDKSSAIIGAEIVPEIINANGGKMYPDGGKITPKLKEQRVIKADLDTPEGRKRYNAYKDSSDLYTYDKLHQELEPMLSTIQLGGLLFGLNTDGAYAKNQRRLLEEAKKITQRNPRIRFGSPGRLSDFATYEDYHLGDGIGNSPDLMMKDNSILPDGIWLGGAGNDNWSNVKPKEKVVPYFSKSKPAPSSNIKNIPPVTNKNQLRSKTIKIDSPIIKPDPSPDLPSGEYLQRKSITSISQQQEPLSLVNTVNKEPFKPSKVFLREMGNIRRYNKEEPYKKSYEMYMDDGNKWRTISPEDYEKYKKIYPGSDKTNKGWIKASETELNNYEQMAQGGYTNPYNQYQDDPYLNYAVGGKVWKNIAASAYGVGKGILDTVTMGATDQLTDKGFEALSKAGNKNIDLNNPDDVKFLKTQQKVKGYSSTAGAIGAGIATGNAQGAIKQGTKGLNTAFQATDGLSDDFKQWSQGITGVVGVASGLAGGLNSDSFTAASKAGTGAAGFGKDVGKFAGVGNTAMGFIPGMNDAPLWQQGDTRQDYLNSSEYTSQKALNNQQYVNQGLSFSQGGNITNNSLNLRNTMRYKRFAKGGTFDQHGINLIPESAGLHHQSAYGGVPIGPDALAEGGEAKLQMADGGQYIVSGEVDGANTQSINGETMTQRLKKNLKPFMMGGLASNPKDKENLRRPFDSYSAESIAQVKDNAIQETEAVRMQREGALKYAAHGGKLNKDIEKIVMEEYAAAYGGMLPNKYKGKVNMPNSYAKGGIHIKESKKGTFTAAATKHGKGVQEFAQQVLANKENYSPGMVKKANFAHNAAGWKHANGGYVHNQMIQPMLAQGGMYGDPYAKGGQIDYTNDMYSMYAGGGPMVGNVKQPFNGPAAQNRGGMYIYPDGGMMQEQQMMQQAPQEQMQQQGGQDQMMQMVQQVIEALMQGANPEQIMQQLVQSGVPQEQAQQIIQVAMQQAQGQQQQQPMQGQEQMMPQEQMAPQSMMAARGGYFNGKKQYSGEDTTVPPVIPPNNSVFSPLADESTMSQIAGLGQAVVPALTSAFAFNKLSKRKLTPSLVGNVNIDYTPERINMQEENRRNLSSGLNTMRNVAPTSGSYMGNVRGAILDANKLSGSQISKSWQDQKNKQAEYDYGVGSANAGIRNKVNETNEEMYQNAMQTGYQAAGQGVKNITSYYADLENRKLQRWQAMNTSGEDWHWTPKGKAFRNKDGVWSINGVPVDPNTGNPLTK